MITSCIPKLLEKNFTFFVKSLHILVNSVKKDFLFMVVSENLFLLIMFLEAMVLKCIF